MQVDRGDRLWKFIMVSMAVHIGLRAYSRYFRQPVQIPQGGGEMEVVLTPPQREKKDEVKTENKQEPKKQAPPLTQRVSRNEPASSPEPPKPSPEPKDNYEKQVVQMAERSTAQSSAPADASIVCSA